MTPFKFEYNDLPNRTQITLVEKPDYISYADLAEQLYSRLPQTTNATEILVVRPPVDKQIPNPARLKKLLTPFFDRMPNASIHLLTSNDFKISLSENLNSSSADAFLDSDGRASFLSWLKDEEMRHYIFQSSALFPAKENMIYRSPSGKYVKTFLRVGSIQTSRRVLDSIFFWAIPYLAGCTGIISETWSISSIALNTARLLERYASKSKIRCSVDMLSQYHDGFSGFDENIRDAVDRVSKSQGQILLLISCVMTGNSLAALKRTIGDYVPNERLKIITLYRLTAHIFVDSLCDFFGRVHDPSFEPIRDRNPGDSVISIDKHTYFPLNIKERRIGINRSDVQHGRDFFDRYRGSNCVSAHRTALDINGNPFRHHGVYVDVSELLKTPQFMAKLQHIIPTISSSSVPSVIVCPPHKAGLELRDQISLSLRAEENGVHKLLTPDLDLNTDQNDIDKIVSISSKGSILIVDDVSISGNRLARYSKRLRELNFQGKIIYLIGVARPQSLNEWDQRKTHLCHRQDHQDRPHEVHAVETVYLPDWNLDSCPWCEELKILERCRQKIENSTNGTPIQMLNDRIRRLTDARESGGLVDDVIWSPGAAPLQLTHNSIFVQNSQTSQADILGVVASTIQSLRTIGRNGFKLEVSFPTANVLNPKLYLGQTFTDLILRTTIIRCAKRSELELWTDEGNVWREQALKKIISDQECSNCLPEFAVQILLRRLPFPTLNETEVKILSNAQTGVVFFELLSANRQEQTHPIE